MAVESPTTMVVGWGFFFWSGFSLGGGDSGLGSGGGRYMGGSEMGKGIGRWGWDFFFFYLIMNKWPII